MKEEFSQYAKGIDQKFMFKGYEYRLETEVDKQGHVKTIRLDSNDLPLALRASIQDEAEMMSLGLRAGGDTLDGLIETFAPKSGAALYPLIIMNGNNSRSSLANHIWGAATQILKREYRAETIFPAPVPKRERPFRVIEGGMA